MWCWFGVCGGVVSGSVLAVLGVSDVIKVYDSIKVFLVDDINMVVFSLR